MDFQNDQGFVIVGAATGQVIASQVGGIGVVGGFGGMALGTPVIVVGGAIAGAAIQGILEGMETGDVKILGVTTVGSVLGAGFSAVVGKVGVGVAGSAFGVGMGTMAATGGLFALGVYQLLKMCSGNTSASKYYENLLFLEQITEEYEEERKWWNLEIEEELQALKETIQNNLQDNEFKDYQWQSLDDDQELETLKQQLKTCLQDTNNLTQVLYDSSQTENHQIITIKAPLHTWQCQELKHFESHHVRTVAISANNRYLLSGDHQGMVYLWDLNTHKLLFTFIGNREEIQAIAVTPDSQKLLAGGFDRRISAWHLEKKSLISGFYSFNSAYSHEGVIHALAVSPDGKWVASGGSDHKIKLWNVLMRQWERTLNAHSDTVTVLAFSHHGQFLVSGSKDQTIRIWNTNDYPNSEILTEQARQITDLKVTQNDHLLISSSLDGMIQIWDLETKSIIQTIDNENQSILSLAINSHLNIFATANHQVTQLWDLQTGKLLQTLSGCHPITFSPDGKILVTGTQTKEKILKIWRYSSKYFETESVQQFDPSQAWWEILGVSPHSDPQEIKMAYYCLAKQFHPDQNSTEEAIESMKIINQAYRQFRNRNPSPTHN